MQALRTVSRRMGLPVLLSPLKPVVCRGLQYGTLPKFLKKAVPWTWAHEPFTIYGEGWQCRWSPKPFDAVGDLVFWTGFREWEAETFPVVLELVRQSRCFIDIGANTGIYSISGCAVNPHLRVVALEPVPKLCSALIENRDLNGFDSRIEVIRAAASSDNGVVVFHEAEYLSMSSIGTTGYMGQAGRLIEVEARRLDSLVSEMELQPDLLKVDVEGAEHLVLAGAAETIARFRPKIVIEVNAGSHVEALNELISCERYACFNLTAKGRKQHAAIEVVPESPNWLCQ